MESNSDDEYVYSRVCKKCNDTHDANCAKCGESWCVRCKTRQSKSGCLYKDGLCRCDRRVHKFEDCSLCKEQFTKSLHSKTNSYISLLPETLVKDVINRIK